MLQRLAKEHSALLNSVQELLLLLLLGVSSTIMAASVDKAIDLLTSAKISLSNEAGGFFSSYLMWTGSSLVCCFLSAAFVQYLGPSAAGSGIPQMKCVLAGVQIHDYLSLRTLVAKVLSLVFALAGGLSIGKEGPYVHVASCIAHQLCRLRPFRRLRQNEQLRRQVLAAACAAGVSATFGAPVGGVLFSIEVTASYYSIAHLWKAMFTSVCGALVFKISRDYGSLKLFDLTDFAAQDLGDLFFNGEMTAFAILGVLCGLLGAAFVHSTASLVRLIRQLRLIIDDSPPHSATRRRRRGAAASSSLQAPSESPHSSLMGVIGGGHQRAPPPPPTTPAPGAPLEAARAFANRRQSGLRGSAVGLGGFASVRRESVDSNAADDDDHEHGHADLFNGGASTASSRGGGATPVTPGPRSAHDKATTRLEGLAVALSGRVSRLRHFRCTRRDVMAAMLSRYGYTLLVAFTSAMLTFPFGFFRTSPEDVINALFGASPFEIADRWANPSLLVNLSIFFVCKFVFTVIAVGCPISCGVFTPVFLIGAAFGRCFGETLNVMTPEARQVVPGAYAVVGAAAMAAGVTRTVSCAVMVFELTGQLNHMLPVLVAVLAAYGIGNVFNSSIYDTMLELNNLPYLHPPSQHGTSSQAAHDVMDSRLLGLSRECTFLDIRAVLSSSDDVEFPIVASLGADRILLGAIRRSALELLVELQLQSSRAGGSAAPLSTPAAGGGRWERLRTLLSGRSRGVKLRDLEGGIPLMLPAAILEGSHGEVTETPTPLTAATAGPASQSKSTRHSEAGAAAAAGAAGAAGALADADEDAASDGEASPRSRVSRPAAPGSAAAGSAGTSDGIVGDSGPAAATPRPLLSGGVLYSVSGHLQSDGFTNSSGGVDCVDGFGSVRQRLANGLDDEALRLLCEPVDFGLGRGRQPASWAEPQPMPGSQAATVHHGLGGGGVASAATFVNRAPHLTAPGTDLDVVHTQLSVLGLERSYVVYAGQLLGVIRRSQLESQSSATASAGRSH
jgi:H+/Cl- antiporter ClcA